MKGKAYLAGMMVTALLLVFLGSGCASSSGYKNPDVEATTAAHRGNAG